MQNKPYHLAVKSVYGISVLFYIISLTQEGFCTVTNCGGNWNGLTLVALGAIGGILSIAGMVWYANPLLWAVWWFLKKDIKKAFYFSIAASVLSLSFLLCTEIADQKPGKVSYITEYRSGYWLWVASIICTLIGSGILFMWRRKLGPEDEEERYYPY